MLLKLEKLLVILSSLVGLIGGVLALVDWVAASGLDWPRLPGWSGLDEPDISGWSGSAVVLAVKISLSACAVVGLPALISALQFDFIKHKRLFRWVFYAGVVTSMVVLAAVDLLFVLGILTVLLLVAYFWIAFKIVAS